MPQGRLRSGQRGPFCLLSTRHSGLDGQNDQDRHAQRRDDNDQPAKTPWPGSLRPEPTDKKNSSPHPTGAGQESSRRAERPEVARRLAVRGQLDRGAQATKQQRAQGTPQGPAKALLESVRWRWLIAPPIIKRASVVDRDAALEDQSYVPVRPRHRQHNDNGRLGMWNLAFDPRSGESWLGHLRHDNAIGQDRCSRSER